MKLVSLFVQPLGPALILSLGGILLAVLRRQMRRKAVLAQMIAGRSLPAWPRFKLYAARLPLALLAVLAAALLLVHLRTVSPRPTLGWTWQPLTVAGSAIEWRLDAWNWLASALIAGLTGIALLLGEGFRGPLSQPRLDLVGVEQERTLYLGAAGLVFVASGNILTMTMGWVILDAALALRLQLSPEAGTASRAWGALSLSGVLLLLLLALLGEDGIRADLLAPRLTGLETGLLWLIALIRAGVYPFHYWLTAPNHARHDHWLPMFLIGPLTGLWLLGRVHALAGAGWLRRPEWIALSTLALLGTALVAWSVEDPNRRWRWIALNRASLAVMVAYTSTIAGPEALAGALVTYGLGCALLAAGGAVSERFGWRGVSGLAALCLWGLPGTVGFLTREALVFPTESAVATPLFGVVMLAEILLVAALWQAAVEQPGPSAAERARGRASALRVALAALLVAVPLIAFGLFPRPLAVLAGWASAAEPPDLASLIAGARRSVWIGLALPAVLGAVLALFRKRLLGQMRGWQAGIAAVASLEWLYRGVAAVFGVFASGLQYFATLGEGEGYLGWLALASLILWVLLRG